MQSRPDHAGRATRTKPLTPAGDGVCAGPPEHTAGSATSRSFPWSASNRRRPRISSREPSGRSQAQVLPAARTPRFQGITVDVMTLASLRCTDVVRTEHHGQVLSCVRGHLKDGHRETVLFPGEIPPELPEPEDWASGRFRFREFAPRRLAHSGAGQHIRLDQALQFLIGDKFA